MGVNQSHEGVRTAQAIINLALITGNIGRPGTGANSITGQCNAMGSRIFSNTTNLLGGRDFTTPEHRRDGRRHPRHPRGPASPREDSLAYDRIIEKILDGQDPRALGDRDEPGPLLDQPGAICSTCSAGSSSWSCRTCTRRPRRPSCADMVLPAAGWGEKEGTFINSERRIGVVKRVARAPGQALADFHIFRLVAEAWGCGDMFTRVEQSRGGVPDPEAAVARAALRHHAASATTR